MESGGDQFKEEGGEEEEEDDDEEDEPDPGGHPPDEVPISNKPIAGSTPIEILSDRSETKIELDLLGKEESPRGSNLSKKSRLTLPDPKEWAGATESGGCMEVKPNPNPEPSLPDVNLDVPIEAVKGPVKTRIPKKEPLKWKRAPLRPAEGRCKFITEKTRILKVDGNDLFNYEPEFALVPKHSNSSNHWSDKDLRTLKNNMRKFEDSEGYMLRDLTLKGIKEILRDHEWDIKMPHKPHSPEPTGYETTLEYTDDEDERKDEKVITVAVISINNDKKSDPLFIQHQHNSYDNYREALRSEILASQNPTLYGPNLAVYIERMIEHKKGKDRLRRRMLEVTSSAPPKASPDNKPISEVHLEYRQDPKAPDVFADSISMRFVNGNEGSKRKEHAKDKVPMTQVSLDALFAHIFHPSLTQLHFTFLTPPFSLMLILVMFSTLCLHAHEQTTRTQFDWYN